MKKITFILLCLGLSSMMACRGEDDDATCRFDDPLQELPWLGDLLDSLSTDAVFGVQQRVVQYRYADQDIFLINYCVRCFIPVIAIHDCEGNILCGSNISSDQGPEDCSEYYRNGSCTRLIYPEE